ncbi:MAG TPA: hypothetical protein VM933_07565 [Acidimicrobiales bacterium]|nr:hypothetical protein [Acidimicrobiales bacterium]
MADPSRTERDDVPPGLLADLAGPANGIRRAEVDRALRHAAERSFDDTHVVEEIATQLLALSRP